MKNNLLAIIGFVGCAFLENLTFSQECVSDAQFTGSDTRERLITSTQVTGQSFKVFQTGTLNSISLDIDASNSGCLVSTMDVNVQIVQGDGVGGTQLASQIFSLPVDMTRSLRTFDFTTPASVTSNQMYTIVVSLESGQSCGTTEPELVWYYQFPTNFWQGTGGIQYWGSSTPSLGNTQYFTTCVACLTTSPVVEDQSFCDVAYVEDIEITGENINWYADANGTTLLNSTDELSSSVYYASNTVNGCESALESVEITVNVPIAPTVEDQTFCDTATIADIVISGTNITWYSDEDGSITLSLNDVLTSTSYYATSSVGGCESEVENVEITINEIPDNTVTLSETTFTAEASDFDYQWIDCNNANTPIAGADDQTFEASSNGSYAVVISNNGCVATSECQIIATISLEEKTKNDFLIYPNPATDIITIELTEANNSIYTITNQIGQVVLNGKIANQKAEINLNKLVSGIYFINLNNETKKLTVK